jgi:hypothetical protein
MEEVDRTQMISIDVKGSCNTGKSSIAEVIRLALEAHGITALVNDFPDERVPDIQKSMPRLAEKLNNNTIITVVQTPRVRYITERGDQ